MKISKILASSLLLCLGSTVLSQGSISGNMESTFQYLLDDEKIDAEQPDEKALINSYVNVNYRNSGFKAGMRLEAYLPAILGYPDRFDGAGLGYRYVGYENDLVDVTVGNFYEQFGSGLIFRSYEDRALGVDNMMNGVSLNLRPYKGVTIKTVYGRQRFSFTEGSNVYTDGIVRGADAEINFNQWFPKLASSNFRVSAGGSFVSKYQEDNNTQLVLPENTGAYGGRMEVAYKKFFINGEYIIKEQDPSQDNGYIYNYGKGLLLNAGYSQKGLGIVVSAKSIDNMSFRSDREAALQDATIGFIPALTKTHTYNLAATLYPYASQPNGEVAYQADVIYKIKRGTKLGGKYGTDVSLNFSTAYAPVQNTSNVNPLDSTRVAYDSKLFDADDQLYWRDFNVSIKRKLNKKWTLKGSYFNISMNNDVLKLTDAKGIIESHIGVLDVQYKINRKNTIRAELQGLWTIDNKDRGDWATFLVEYTISPDWFFSALIQSNYGNPVEEDQIHYPMVVVGKIWGATRLQVGYGRQNEGLFCVGGICRQVPSSNGLTVSFTHSF
ncbi:DUF6029 family protein [Brumimicrobium aurantiacum]|uniref:DUF5723 domain-containing protein n=1 Tax=Brumimicrobium aurantiacum TaxID=1737063 RepID=A0A3E1F294_9FLAO|nr:DUF6029 family protein [Brumimicrobium aurantiacum]RFC55936.1 hypothetical protein DXU93_03075 [Brumimicrobium aurantiacum]